ncbi:MAG: glycerol-3-phosphate acyltransferase [Verrucomicrobia bacterium]|nr:glycerol-3-phosphate acyltransferase [Verrucomicrobiota bacterium]
MDFNLDPSTLARPTFSPVVDEAMMNYLLATLLGFMLGSPPCGFLVAKVLGMDIRQHGSGNIGATNVFRQLGWKWGVLVLLLDGFKGWLACELALRFLAPGEGMVSPIALTPFAFMIALGTFVVSLTLFRMVSLGSVLAALALPIAVVWHDGMGAMLWVSIILCLLAWWKHLPNLKRILGGTEPKIGRRQSPPPSTKSMS